MPKPFSGSHVHSATETAMRRHDGEFDISGTSYHNHGTSSCKPPWAGPWWGTVGWLSWVQYFRTGRRERYLAWRRSGVQADPLAGWCKTLGSASIPGWHTVPSDQVTGWKKPCEAMCDPQSTVRRVVSWPASRHHGWPSWDQEDYCIPKRTILLAWIS